MALKQWFRPVELTNPAPTGTARKGLLSIITIGLQGGSRFLSNWLIGRIAGKIALGAVSSATALAFTLHTLWTSTAPSAASKFIARARGKGDDAELYAVTRHTGTRVLQVTAALAVAAPPLWVLLYQGTAWEGLCVSAILITVATSQFARGVHFGAGQVARGTKIDLLTSTIGIVGTLALLLAGVTNLALTLPLSFAMGSYALLCWPWTAHGTPEKALRREIDKFVAFGALGSIASAGMLQLGQLVARGMGPQAAGTYAPALQLVTPLSIIASALTLVLYPSMAEAQGAGDAERLTRQTDLATRGFVAVLVPVFGAMAISSRPVIDLVWGSGHHDSWALMPVFCIPLMLNNIAAPSVSSITSGPHKHMWYSLLLSQAGLVAAVLCWVTLTDPLGLFGVALGYGIGASVTAVGLVLVAWRLSSQRWAGLMGSVVVGTAVIALLTWWRLSQPLNYWIDLATAAGFAVAWLAVSFPTLRRLVRLRQSS